MRTRCALITVILVAALLGVAKVNMANASKTLLLDPLLYTVEQRPNGYFRVHVQVNLENRGVRERYATQQRAAALALAKSGLESIPVQITFARPLSVEEIRLLAQQTGLLAEWLIFMARDIDNNMHAVVVRGAGIDIVDLNDLLSDIDTRGLCLVGAMVVRGVIPTTNAGLGRLAGDARIYLLDVTPYQLALEVAKRYGVSFDRVQVSAPTPYWDLLIGR